MIIKLPACLDNYKERKDGSTSLKFDSREISEEEVLILRRFRNVEGWMLFSTDDLNAKDVPDEEPEVDMKTPAQRLRAVLFLRWKMLGEPNTFRAYYDKSMEHFINEVKSKLE